MGFDLQSIRIGWMPQAKLLTIRLHFYQIDFILLKNTYLFIHEATHVIPRLILQCLCQKRKEKKIMSIYTRTWYCVPWKKGRRGRGLNRCSTRKWPRVHLLLRTKNYVLCHILFKPAIYMFCFGKIKQYTYTFSFSLQYV